jgi:Fe-S-cluster-containing dehydrogenase component
MTKYGMLIQADKCIGCSTCTIACKDEFVGNAYAGYSGAQPATTYGVTPSTWPNQGSTLQMTVENGQNWINFGEQVNGTFPNVKARFVYEPCMQCDNPPCVAASTNSAVYARPDGIVLIDPTLSTNQTQLPASCPYGRIYWNDASSIAQKCTFCAHLVDQGKNPKCVDACPVTAIIFGDLSVATSTISKSIVSLNAQPLHPEYGTKPKVYYSGLIQ